MEVSRAIKSTRVIIRQYKRREARHDEEVTTRVRGSWLSAYCFMATCCVTNAIATAQVTGTGQFDLGPPNLVVGNTATGSVTITGVSVDRDPGSAVVGAGNGGDGTLTINEAGTLSVEHLTVGGQGKGSLLLFSGARIAGTGGTAQFNGAPGLPAQGFIHNGSMTDFLEINVGVTGDASFSVVGPDAALPTNTLWLTFGGLGRGTGEFADGAFVASSRLILQNGDVRFTGADTLCEPGLVEISGDSHLDIEDGAVLSVQGLEPSSRIDIGVGHLRVARTEEISPPPMVSAESVIHCGARGSIEVTGGGSTLTLDNGQGFISASCGLPVLEPLSISVTDGGIINAGDLFGGRRSSTPQTIDVCGTASHLDLTGSFRIGVADFSNWEATVSDGAELTADVIELAVGNSARAALLLANQARVTSTNVKVGVPTAEEPGDVGTEGTIEVCGGSILDVGGGGVEVGPHGTLKGSGMVIGSVVNNGVVQAGCSPGVLHVTADFEDSSNARLVLPLIGINESNVSHLVVDGSVKVAGTIEIELRESFPLDPHLAESVVTAAGGATFLPGSAVLVTGLTGGLLTDVVIEPDGILFTAIREPGRGDFNDDGVTDLLDLGNLVACFYGPGDLASEPGFCETDIDGDRDIDLRDYAGFTQSFGEATP